LTALTQLLPIAACALAAASAAAWLFARAAARAGALRLQAEAQLAAARSECARLEAAVAGLDARLEEKRARESELRAELDAAARAQVALRGDLLREQEARAGLVVELRAARESAEEKLLLLRQEEKNLADRFEALSAEALRKSNQTFLELAKTQLASFQQGARGDLDQRQQAIVELVKPVQETLHKFNGKLQEIEVARVGAYGELRAQVQSLFDTQSSLRSETANLVKALRAPAVRGRWAEIHLKRVVEMAGMIDHCDFHEQVSVSTADGRLRPDLVVNLPGGKSVVVDAKAPLQAYLEAHEATDEATRKAKLEDHARQVRQHLAELGRKAYWEQFPSAPDFVVLFLPNDGAYLAALEIDPGLIEAGVNEKVILATPTTLIAVLRAVAYGWQQQRIAENAQAISQLGRDLYERVATMAAHLSKLGKKLAGSVEAYNEAVGSIERRILPTARRLKDKVAGPGDELEPLLPVDTTPRALQAAELVAPLLPEDAN
jgi:DNA recombination protein RmuC